MEKRYKTFHIITYGCQMNQYDSGIIKTILERTGMKHTELKKADVILINTCAVREHAEKRVIGRIHSLGRIKKKREIKIGVIGCMAKRLPELLELPEVDFVAGPDSYRKLPALIERKKIYEEGDIFEDYTEIWPQAPSISAYVSITRGCDNFCSYCIVPYVRGPLRSRSPDSIINEIEELIDNGVKEIILLGQNVNRYHYKGINFTILLKKVSEIKDIEMLNFLTSHPRDIDYNMFEIMAGKKNILKYIHLPVQSGSNRILKLMNRGYTAEEYKRIVKRLRSIIPEVTLTTDILVAFPGETEKDFLDTIKLVEEIEFDQAFMFRFSPRPGTLASLMDEYLDDGEKIKRLQRLIRIQNEITHKKNKEMVGKTFRCMVMKRAKKGGTLCKTWTGKYIAIEKAIKSGNIVNVKVKGLRGNTPVGDIINQEKEE